MFENTIYIRLNRNKVTIRHIETKKQVVIIPKKSFTTERLLIGDFSNAENAIKDGIRKLYTRKWFSPSPKMLIQQLEMNEGGLSEVENRILKEVSIAVGARNSVVWDGDELTDKEVLGRVNNV